ncbi:Choline/ethanolamine kinase isoform X2 [Oopsacas minuta]|uniref:Choline/ethanolamine kinase isoform X2 n=1 Tax=Oopsacas minuta TaxID=111878 RepID=A0AAV7KM01_9METZ|nr:Choline/ethanolamine kinase isoform X2 [Oopsacas minuta]
METENLISNGLLERCREYMGDYWTLNKPNISVSVVTGGLTNSLFLLKIESNDIGNIPNSPICCLLRVFANIWSQEQVATNNVISTVLAERGFGPKIYGVLPGMEGRLEEFYFCRQLHTSEMIPNFDTIAEITGKFNRQTLPLPKNGNFLTNSMQGFLEKINCTPIKIEANKHNIEQLRNEVNWKEEIQWMGEYLRSIGSPLLLCHNDINESNLLLLTDGQLKLIDFEFVSYNYRGFELAQLFYECSITMTYPDYPYFKHSPGDYPSYEARREFVAKYLAVYQPGNIPCEEEIHSVVLEVEKMKIAVDLYWVLWAIAMAFTDDRFGYPEYAQLRIDLYRLEKAKLPIT